MKHLHLTILLLLAAFTMVAQTKTVTTRGEFSVTDDSEITFRQAKEEARNDAKKKALVEVCGQRISTWEQVEGSSMAGETYSSATSSEAEGVVVDFEIIKEGRVSPADNQSLIVFYCDAKVKVKKGEKPDLAFNAEIDSLDALYVDGDLFSFLVKPTIDCYLNIFIYESPNSISRLYPNEYEPVSEKLKAHVYEEFPTISDIRGYTINKQTNNPSERNKILFFFTKEPWEPAGKEYRDDDKRLDYYTREELERQMMRVPANKRLSIWKIFDIKAKRKGRK